MEKMTPKEQYEARKAERNRRRDDERHSGRSDYEKWAVLDILDRFTVAAERIADALERQASPLANLKPWEGPSTTQGMSENGVG